MGATSLIAYDAYLKMLDLSCGCIVRKAIPYAKTGCTRCSDVCDCVDTEM